MQVEFEIRSDGLWGPKIDAGEIRPYTFDVTDMDVFRDEKIGAINWTVTLADKHAQSFTDYTTTVVIKNPSSTSLEAKCEITTTPSAYKFIRSFKAEVGAR